MPWVRSPGVKLHQFVLCLLLSSVAEAHSIGAVYGRTGDDIPSASDAAALMQANSITRVRIYDHDKDVLQAFASTQVRVIIAVTNEEITSLASGTSSSDAWVKSNISPYITTTNINAIAVGNEVLTTEVSLAPLLVPAMQNLQTSLTSQGFNSVKVSSPHGLGILELSYPPSAGVFFDSLQTVLQPLLAFLESSGSFFMFNVYPYYLYLNGADQISLDYVLFNTGSPVLDSTTGLEYLNSYDAQVDALVSAMAKLNYSDIGIVVTETGWPSDGDPSSDPAANYQNARTYNQHLVQRTMNNSGTPLRPGADIPAYIVSLYDEDERSSPPESNRHWGLFYINGSSKYDFEYLTGATTNGGGGGGGEPGNPPPPGTPPGTPSGTPPPPTGLKTWCVAKPGADNSSLQQGLDWACGAGRALCTPIQSGGDCYLPNSLVGHASYAFNIHYHFFQTDQRSCIFGGDAELTTVDPSYGSCVYVASSATGRMRMLSSQTSLLVLLIAAACLLFAAT